MTYDMKADLVDLIALLESPAGRVVSELDARVWYVLHRDALPHDDKGYHFAETMNRWVLGSRKLDFANVSECFTTNLNHAFRTVPLSTHVVIAIKNGDLDTKYGDIRRHRVWSVMLGREHYKITDPFEVVNSPNFPRGAADNPAHALVIASMKARLDNLEKGVRS